VVQLKYIREGQNLQRLWSKGKFFKRHITNSSTNNAENVGRNRMPYNSKISADPRNMAHKEFGKVDIHQIPIRRMIEPAGHEMAAATCLRRAVVR
jgi:hypothetical protein